MVPRMTILNFMRERRLAFTRTATNLALVHNFVLSTFPPGINLTDSLRSDIQRKVSQCLQHFARIASNEDLIARLLLTSDPVYSQKFSKFSTRAEMDEELAELLVIEESGESHLHSSIIFH